MTPESSELAKKLELWDRVVCVEYPSMSEADRIKLYWRAAVDYSLDYNSKNGQLFEQFVIMKTLSMPKKDDNET